MKTTSFLLFFTLTAPAFAQTKALRCSGTVTDAAGKPVTGAVVELYQLPQRYPPSGPTLKSNVTTDTTGAYSFQLPEGTSLIFVYKTGLAPTWVQHWNPQSDLTDEQLVMTPAGRIGGSIVDDTDKPVGGAKVWVTSGYLLAAPASGRGTISYLNQMPKSDLLSAVSGPDGQFQIQGVPTNAALDLAVKLPGKVLRQPQREYISPETMRCRPGQQDVKLVLEPAGVVSGRIRSLETGKAVGGARIDLLHQGRMMATPVEPVSSDAQGRFLLASVSAGTYRVHAATASTNRVPEWVAETLPIVVEAGRTTRDLEVSAARGGFLQVSVLGREDKKPPPSATISAFKEDFNTWAACEADGLALLRLPAGEYQVSASAYNGNSSAEPVRATVETDKTNRLEIELSAPPMVRGIVRDPSGAPVSNLALTLFPPYGYNAGPVKTGPDGKFEFAWKPQRMGMQEKYSIIARDLQRGLAAAQDLEEEGGQLELRLQPALVLSGAVQDTAGKPLSNAVVQLFLWSGNSGSQLDEKPARTDARGQFQFRNLPLDRHYSVSATAPGYGSANKQLQADDTNTNRLELEAMELRVADRQLAGEVIGSDEKPAVGASVHIYGEGQPNASTRTDDRGRFRFDQVCEGNIQVSANLMGVSRAFGNARAQGGDTNVTIKLGVPQSFSSAEPSPRRISLKGKPLPELAGFELPADCPSSGKAVLVCLFDLEQRPSRRALRVLSEQHGLLSQKNITVVAIQAAVATPEAFKEWKDGNSLPFPVGRIAERNEKNKWASGAESLPWLILTDAGHQVLEEGFALEDLETKIKK